MIFVLPIQRILIGELQVIWEISPILSQSLKQFAIDFGDGGKDGNKGVFPYDAINTENYKEVLRLDIPFSQEDFNNKLRGEQISDDDYKLYLEDSKNFNNRWDYLQYYNELDTTIMIKPIDRLIEMNFSNGIDTFNYVSMANCANSIKYMMACQDFDLNSRYVNKDDSSLTCYQPFEFTYDYQCRKVGSYNIQDLKAGRDRNYNINESDYEYYKELIKTSSCWFCKAKFTILNQPTLDRIDSSLGHSKDNVRFACQYCNVAISNRDAKITRLKIQLKRYYLAKGLPCPITSEDTYHVLRNGITGGLANVIHRYNIKGETHINKMMLEDMKVISYDSDNVMTHITGVDFNSLYPAVFSGLKHNFIKYTGHQIYMPGYELERYECQTEQDKQKALQIINNPLRFSQNKSDIDKVTFFVTEIKGHIDDQYINDYINCPPIIRKLKFKCLENVIGKYMYDHQVKNNLPKDREECKLTSLLSTMGQFMSFSSYYLWFLIDDCHFIIDVVKSIMTFSKHNAFAPFVQHFSQQRIKAKLDKNKGLEQYNKISMNSSYGSDGMNQEQFTDIKMCDRNETFRAHLYKKFKGDRKLADNVYAV
ncbi:MAG: hypothetical protein EZS28_040150, partial [Streblomastix strix]